jgi:type I restriction enzyme, S subunit
MMSISGWENKPLGTVAEIVMGQSPDSKYYSEEEVGNPFLQGCAEFTNKYPIASLYCSQIKKLAITGSILFSVRAPVGRINLANFDYIIGRGLAAFSATQISQDYLYHYLLNSENDFRNAAQGSTFEAINSKELNSWSITFPALLEEQEQIAAVLSTIDLAITQTEAIIAKQQRIKTGLMQDLLTKGIDENGNIRSEATHEFKDSAIGRIPVEWDVQCLANLLENIYQGWSPDCESDSASEDEWAVLKTTAVTWDGYDSRENKKLPNSLKPRPLLEIKKGDVLITRAGPNSRVGVISYVYETLRKKILSDKIYSLKFKEYLDPRFFAYSLSGFASQQYLSALKTGMAESQTNISQEIVKKILTVIPPAQEQIYIADLLDQALHSYKDYLTTRNKLYVIKTGLMQDLLTGKVRVTPLLEKEPASR